MWQLVENRASLSLGPWSAACDLARPDAGIQSVSLLSDPWPGAALLEVHLPTSASPADVTLSEAYIRGCDLVAIYAPLPPFTIQPQIYWRLRQAPARDAYGVELILSVQTSQLDSEPFLPVSSQLTGITSITTWMRGGKSQSLRVSDLPCTLRSADGAEGMIGFESRNLRGHVYVEMVHPSDFHTVTIESASNGRVRVVTENFREHLEKGVIRRARICGWFLTQADWRNCAWELFDAFRNEPAPLTA